MPIHVEGCESRGRQNSKFGELVAFVVMTRYSCLQATAHPNRFYVVVSPSERSMLTCLHRTFREAITVVSSLRQLVLVTVLSVGYIVCVLVNDSCCACKRYRERVLCYVSISLKAR